MDEVDKEIEQLIIDLVTALKSSISLNHILMEMLENTSNTINQEVLDAELSLNMVAEKLQEMMDNLEEKTRKKSIFDYFIFDA